MGEKIDNPTKRKLDQIHPSIFTVAFAVATALAIGEVDDPQRYCWISIYGIATLLFLVEWIILRRSEKWNLIPTIMAFTIIASYQIYRMVEMQNYSDSIGVVTISIAVVIAMFYAKIQKTKKI